MTIHPWHQRENETSQAFEAFVAYRDLQGDRRLRYAAEKVGKHMSNIKRWSARHGWVDRVRLYDAWLTNVSDEERTAQLGGLKTSILVDESNDYRRLRNLWLAQLEEVEDLIEEGEIVDRQIVLDTIGKLAKTRREIDSLGRRAAKMPTTYKPETENEDIEPTQFLLNVGAAPTPLITETN